MNGWCQCFGDWDLSLLARHSLWASCGIQRSVHWRLYNPTGADFGNQFLELDDIEIALEGVIV